MRIVFIGTADFGGLALESLLGLCEHQVVGVVTQPDRPVGRRQELTPPPIKVLALKHGLAVLQPERIRRPEAIAQLRDLAPDLCVVIAYGQILPKELLSLPKLGCINVHGSLLPRWRGASPIQSALLAGDARAGVTTMLMDEGLDTGPMLLRGELAIEPADNAAILHDKLAVLGADLLVKTVAGLVQGGLKPTPQPTEGVTYAAKIKKEDGLVNWSLPASELLNRLRAFTPWPGLFTHLPEEKGARLLKIISASVKEGGLETGKVAGTVLGVSEGGLEVATGSNRLIIREMQLEGGRRMTVQEYLRGRSIPMGVILGRADLGRKTGS